MKINDLAISWLLHSIKILLGDESIRRYIILNTIYNLKHTLKKDIRTFDPFVKKNKTRQDKYKIIEKYLDYVITLDDIIVFTATNVQQHENDNETHYQSFIVDNDNKKVYVIDPAFDKKQENYIGIYYAEVTHESIKPYFEMKGYNVSFIHLKRPAQSTKNDVFCQTWSLLILLEILENKKYKQEGLEIKIPKLELERYRKILEFYKAIFKNMPELQENLREEYKGSISDAATDTVTDASTATATATATACEDLLTEEQKQQLLEIDAYELLESMDEYDMKK
jgi:hypothetical protein